MGITIGRGENTKERRNWQQEQVKQQTTNWVLGKMGAGKPQSQSLTSTAQPYYITFIGEPTIRDHITFLVQFLQPTTIYIHIVIRNLTCNTDAERYADRKITLQTTQPFGGTRRREAADSREIINKKIKERKGKEKLEGE